MNTLSNHLSDTPQNSPVKKQQQPNSNSNISQNNISNNKHIGNNNGVTSLPIRNRKLSNSSIASDVSFRLPTFDSPAVIYILLRYLTISINKFIFSF